MAAVHPDTNPLDGSSTQYAKTSCAIPIVRCSLLEDQKAYCQILRALEAAPRITIICGAGISTSAGIPDFRSADGLYNQSLPVAGKHKLGPEMFDSRTLQDSQKLTAYGRAIGTLRMISRNARPTACHNYIARLYELGRLLRCYTQNVDGLQTRGRPHLAKAVLELHGNIHTLKCNRCSNTPDEDAEDIDQDLQRIGYVFCKKCQYRGSASNSRWDFRALSPGLLLPQVLHNDGSWEPQSDDMSLGQLERTDGSASLLLVIGTSIKTEGAAKLVKSLSRKVHQAGGVVVYIDRMVLQDRKWEGYIDLQLQVELEKWALDALSYLNLAARTIDTKREVTNVIQELSYRSIRPTPKKDPPRSVEASLPCSNNSAHAPGPIYASGMVKVVILVCHSGAATFLAHALAVQLVDMIKGYGWMCHAYVVVLSGLANDISSVPGINNHYMIVVHLSDYVFRLHNGWKPVETGQTVQESVASLSNLSERSIGQLLLLICAEDELLSRHDIGCLQGFFEQQSTFDTMVTTLNLSRFKVHGWARFVADFVLSQRQSNQGIVSSSAKRWMKNTDLYESSDFVVFSRSARPTMILASCADRPLGKPLPRLEDVCPCQPVGLASKVKKWEMYHNAVDGCAVRDVQLMVRCSGCQQSWNLETTTLVGTVTSIQGRSCIQVQYDSNLGWV